MNRIEEIASRAMDIVSNSRMIKGQVERTWDPKLYDQVFAELIIEECAKIAEKVTFDSEGVSFEIDLQLFKHFGVGDV